MTGPKKRHITDPSSCAFPSRSPIRPVCLVCRVHREGVRVDFELFTAIEVNDSIGRVADSTPSSVLPRLHLTYILLTTPSTQFLMFKPKTDRAVLPRRLAISLAVNLNPVQNAIRH
jgi:hypothetical protein